MKQFLIIGNQNAITYKEIFPYIKDNQMWMGYGGVKDFIYPDGELRKFGNICWFTNLPVYKENGLVLTESYYDENGNPRTDKYPKYDNYDAIEVSRTKDIPYDYQGVMGVPITFLYKYCPSQFEIVDAANRYLIDDYFSVNEKIKNEHSHCTNVNGVPKYFRVLIKPQFEIVQLCASHGKIVKKIKNESCCLNGKWLYARILIRPNSPEAE